VPYALPAVTSGASPLVNYDAVAQRYAVSRALSSDALSAWRAAVEPHLSRRPRMVVDVGSGTGTFGRAWMEWTEADVVGVEPSSAMLRIAASSPVARLSHIQGVAEALPLADQCVDFAWVSAAFHHFTDQQRAAREMARVLRTDGRVLLRGVVRERTPLSWLVLFPGRDKPLSRYPTLEGLKAVFGRAGLRLVAAREVQEPGRTNRDQADWIESMRDADSILTALSDDEIAAGVGALRQRRDETMPVSLTLTVFG
jgi:SAM-dependent methyltransferase